MACKLNIKDWALEDRPREKLMAQGAAVLSDAELLAILVGSGNADETAVELMRRIMNDCDNNLSQLGRLTLEQLTKYKGMGPAKAVTIMAACELGRRRSREEVAQKKISKSQDIAAYYQPTLQDLSHEECHLLILRNNLTIQDSCLISRGGITASAVDIRMILRETIARSATSIALCHNHPSGNLTPSTEDKQLTTRLQKACEVMQIKLLDHIIVSCMGYYSFADEGIL